MSRAIMVGFKRSEEALRRLAKTNVIVLVDRPDGGVLVARWGVNKRTVQREARKYR